MSKDPSTPEAARARSNLQQAFRRPTGNARGSGYQRTANDWYCEPPGAVDAVIAAEGFDGLVYDPACGGGNIPRRCLDAGIPCVGSDLVDRGAGWPALDFLDLTPELMHAVARQTAVEAPRHILTNPPFALAVDFVELARQLVPGKVVVLQRLAWLEGQKRRVFFERTRLSRVWVHAGRISMPPGDSDALPRGGSVAFAWYVWEPGWTEAPRIGWL